MEIIKLDSYETVSRQAASLILSELEQNKNALLCAATGNSPTGTYASLKTAYELKPELFSSLRVIKLDEWGGVAMDNKATCEAYLQKHFIGPLQINTERYISFESNSRDPVKECGRIQEELKKTGPIDICILGLGMNGHLALNEPGESVEAGVHVEKLSETSMEHPMIRELEGKPSYGLTLGMADILQSRFILLIVIGAKKKGITAELLKKKVSTALPASFLWLHPNAICLIEHEAYPQE